MKCPKCNGKAKVTNTVHDYENRETHRSRICLSCGHKFYSSEFETVPTARFELLFKRLHSERVLKNYVPVKK